MSRCRRCHHPLPEQARFCPNCGHPVEAPSDSDRARRERLASAAPAALAAKMLGRSDAGERKPVTALFADVVGSTAILERVDPEEWSAIISRGFEVMSHAVFRYEGTIAHLLGDGLLAFFGAPVAHEDDPERAVRAALDMQRDVGTLGRAIAADHGIDFQIRVGINTGPVIVGEVGSDLRYEYTAIGDAINVAARIQAAARPGTILITDAVHRFVGARFELADAGALELKGKSRVVRAYEVVGEKDAPPQATRGIPGLQSPMVGRSVQLERLRAAVAAAAAGRGGIAIVIGEPGIGKTRLVSELRAAVGGDVAVWGEGRGLSYGRNLPHSLTRGLVDALLAGAPVLDGGTRAVLDHLAGRPTSGEDAAGLSTLDPQALRVLYVDAVSTLLRQAARRGPVVVLCEDVHWADPASVDVLEHLLPVAASAPVVFVCTTRDERESAGWRLVETAAVVAGVAVDTIALAPLDETDARQMIGALLAIESLPQEMRDAILERAAGNPFFVEEIIRMMIERGAIDRRGERWVATEHVLDVTIPDTIHGLLLSRIDRLPPDARTALRVASVIGRAFDHDLLDDVLGAFSLGAASGEPVAPLIASGLVVGSGGAGLLFRHVLIQETAYGSLLRQSRSVIHGLVAEALEARMPPGEGETAGLVALHYERAGLGERALPHLLAAGRYALRRFANLEAHDFFSRAEAAIADAGSPAMLRQRVEAGLGRLEAGMVFTPAGEVIDALEALLPAAERLADLKLIGDIHYWIVRNRHLRNEMPATSPPLRASLERVLEIAEQIGDSRLRARPLALVGESKFVGSDFSGATRAFDEAAPLLEEHGSYAEAAYWGGLAAIAHAQLGDFDEAQTWTRRIGALADRSRDPHAVMDANIHTSIVETARGNFSEAMPLVRRGIELAEQLDNKACLLVGLYVEGQQQLQQGRPELALDPLERSTDVAQYCDVADIENLSRALLGLARSQLGRSEQSLVDIEESLRRAREIGDRLGEAEILQMRAIVRAQLPSPEWDAVVADFEEAVALFDDLGTRPYRARALRDFGLALERAGRSADARARLAEAAGLLTDMGIAPA